VFYRDPDGRLMCLPQNADKVTWGAAAHLAGALLIGDPVVGVNGDGRLEVHFVGGDGALWHIWTDGSGLEGWKQDRWGGGNVRDLAVTTTADGRQAFFHANTSGQLWLLQQSAANGYWSDFANPVNGVAGPPAVAAPSDGSVVAVFAGRQGDQDNVLCYARQATDGAWAGPHRVNYAATPPTSNPAVRPAVVRGAPGGRVVVANAAPSAWFWILAQPADDTPDSPWTVLHSSNNFGCDRYIAAAVDGSNRVCVLASSSKTGGRFMRITFK
jgi:hypothetical protein